MKNKIRLLLLSIIIFHCSTGEVTYTVETIEGVRTVHNIRPLWSEPKIALKLEQTYGELESEDPNYLMHRINDIAIDKDGNRYILDSGNGRIQKFDLNGNYLQTIGRKGQGPGELGFPTFIDLDLSDNIYIADGSNKWIQIFNSDGQSQRTIRSNLTMVLGVRKLNNSENFAVISEPFSAMNPGKWNTLKPLVHILNKNGEEIQNFVEAIDYGESFTTFTGNAAYFSLDSEDNICITYVYQNRIEKYSPDGRRLMKIDRQFDRVLEEIPIIDGRLNPSALVSFGISVDHKERIWVITFSRTPIEKKWRESKDLFEYQIFDKNGIFLQKLAINDSFNKFRIIEDRLFFVNNDGYSVKEYKIIEN